ncbi:hypothetical protein DTL70_25295 [Streptomyces diacarni]|uniref:Uncharacterized protein n=1 Tax=Streptomyces diacarni TaxID=2800381 RepID=A0A367EML7_9ACTN|nr:hypothetical protein [Streptomyces diacarni]RCG18932.1 hypothetical protein DTL70_25295 [Streptomyces diacarni]
MVRARRTFALAIAVGSVAVAASAGSAAASPAVAAPTCIGKSFSGTLGKNKAICNSGYKLTMQDNGDLVLRRSNGTACYASGTRAPGDASAQYVKNLFGKPYIDINSTSQGRVGRILGAHTGAHFGTNASVNNKGEFWVGYKKVGWC